MDQVGIGIGVNLSGGTVTTHKESPSIFQRRKASTDKLFPGRFVHYMNLDYTHWDRPDFSDTAVAQIEEGHRLGAGLDVLDAGHNPGGLFCKRHNRTITLLKRLKRMTFLGYTRLKLIRGTYSTTHRSRIYSEF